MPTLISKLSGNFLDAATWALCHAATGLDSEANSTASSTANSPANGTTSVQFAPGAITIDGFALKILSKTSGGTFTAGLYNNTAAALVAGSDITVTVADLPLTGWIFLKFANPITLLAANNYIVQMRSSTNNTVTLYRTGTLTQWTRQLRTTTTQVPAAGDQFLVMGELTGPGLGNNIEVTMNETAATIYGSTAYTQSIAVNLRGSLTFGVAASTNYQLRVRGFVRVNDGGILNIGTIASPIPSSSSARLQFDVVGNVDSGLTIGSGGTWNAHGAVLSVWMTYLIGGGNAGSTAISVLDQTNWKNGDNIALPSTSRVAADSEVKALTADAFGLTLSIAALAATHAVFSPIQGEVVNLTRNVKVLGVSSTLQAFVHMEATSTSDVRYVEFKNLGSGTAGRRGIECAVTTGAANFQYCSIWDGGVASCVGWWQSGATANNVTFSNNVVYNFIGAGAISISATSSSGCVYHNNILIHLQNNVAFSIGDVGGTVTSNIVVGGNVGFNVFDTAVVNVFDGNICHSAQGSCMVVSTVQGGVISNTTLWRSNFTVAGLQLSAVSNLTFENLTIFGCNVASLYMTVAHRVTFINFVSNGDSVYPTASALNLGVSTAQTEVRFINSALGVAAGYKTAHTQDVPISGTSFTQLIFQNTVLGSATEVSSPTSLMIGAYVSSQNHDDTSAHKTWFRSGIIGSDSVIGEGSGSQRLTPSHATNKLESAGFRVAVNSGESVTVSARVRESVVGDGANYNGERICLVLKENHTAGITEDLVLAVATGASTGAFESISGVTPAATRHTVLEFVVDCNGTAGWVNLVSWSATPSQNTQQMQYWADGLPQNYAAGGNSIFYAAF